jgi:poly-gamma-glutamate capsule biosynthesis protein CapA/YwtB (metallophosphatase superfamily)
MARSLTLALTGDVMLGRLTNEAIARRGFAYPWGAMQPLLQQADAVLINLECTLTGRTQPWYDGSYKPFYFRADPSAVETLLTGHVAFASVANNHIGDFDTDGLVETLEVLDRAGIAHAGAGLDLAEARRPATLTVDGYRIGIVAFADYPLAWAATATTPGINYTPVSVDPEDFAEVTEAIAATRQQADLVIFSIHWGPNMRARPVPAFREFARRVVGAGVDIFWGHSAHVVQGVEIADGKLILYDTGDFVDDYAVDAELRNDLSALFLVRIEPPWVTGLEIVPVKIAHMQVNPARGKDRDWFIRRFTALCAEMGTEVSAGRERLIVPTQTIHR